MVMKKNKNKSTDPDSLRSRAKEKLEGMTTDTRIPIPDKDPQKLLQELQTYQIELEMQNEELRKTNEKMEEILQKFSVFYDSAPVGYFSLNRYGSIIALNLAGADLIGIERFRLINKFFWRFISDETRPVFNAFLSKVFDTGTKESCELVLMNNGGHLIDVHIMAKVYTDGQECYTIVTDITEHKLTDKLLLNSMERYQRITEAITDYLYTVTVKNGKPVETRHSEACISVTGYSSREFADDPYLWIRMVPDEDRDIVRKQAEEVLSGHSPNPIEHRVIQKDGRLCWVESSIVPNYDIAGDLVSYDGIVRDITERKQAEELTRYLLRRQTSLLDAVPDIIMEVDNNKVYKWANQPGLDFFGEDVIGKEASFYFEGEQAIYNIVEPLFYGSEGVIYIESWQRRKDGRKRLLAWWCKVIKDNTGNVTGALSSARDITERKQAEEEKDKMQEQLRQAQKMETVGVLAGGVAHDFNNILSAIIGYASLLEKKIPAADPLHDYVDVILQSSEKAASLVQSLLAFSRKKTMELHNVNLNNVIFAVHKLLERIISEDIEIRVIVRDTDLVVVADKLQIEQALINLATNARDAMPEGGILTITADKAAIDDQFIQSHQDIKTGRYAVITVADTGMGMDEKTRENIFEPFFTTKEVGKGTGLGLAMVYGTIKQHEGFINVYSEPGKGTTFRIYLPLSESIVEPIEEKEFVPVPSGNETILLVEDNMSVRETIKIVIEEFGYKVLEAVDGEDGLSMFTKHRESIQLIISDVVMPNKHGREMYEEVKKTNPDIKIIFMSGYSADVIDSKGLLEEELHFMDKPVKPDKLLRMIREVLDS
jgi:PAS domain S-box-containing protein